MGVETNGASVHLKRNTIGGVIGNVLEWYDFAAGYMMRPVRVADFGHRRHCCAGLLPDSHGVCRPRGDALEDPTRRGANVNTLPTGSGRARKLS